jgi:hypothetical protein
MKTKDENFSKIGICKSCLHMKKLCEAHIITRSFHDPSSHLIKEKLKYTIRCSKGSFDNRILCEECDNRFNNRYENDAKRILLDREGVIKSFSQDPNSNRKIAYYKLIDKNKYDTITKFFLLNLWRMSISKGRDFHNFTLGKYEEIARNILLDQNSDFKKYFSLMLCCFKNFHGLINIVSPARIKIHDVNFIPLIIGGLKAFVRVDKKRMPAIFQPFEVSKENDILMLETDISKIKEYNSILQSAAKIRNIQPTFT